MEVINKYFPELSEAQKKQLELLHPLYVDWNSKINVISRKDLDQFYVHHVLHALSIAKFDLINDGQTVIDLGTGGGFPGIPLAIYYPNTQFVLADSIAKKIKVVSAVTDYLNLKNVQAVNDRVENLNVQADIIVSRAVAPALKIIELSKGNLKENGTHLFLKGGDLSAELRDIQEVYPDAHWKEHELSACFEEEFFETKKLVVCN